VGSENFAVQDVHNPHTLKWSVWTQWWYRCATML